MTDIAIVPEAPIQIGTSRAESGLRREILGLLDQLPTVADFIARASPKDTFRVVLKAGQVSELHREASGLIDPFILGSHGIAHNAKLVMVGTDMLSMGPNAIMFVAMRAVAAKLASIDGKIDTLGNMLTFGQHGRLRGAINALETARRLSAADDRRRSMLQAAAVLEVEVLATAGLLKAQIGAMPDEKTGRLQGLFGSGFDKARRAFEPVCETVAAIGHGTAALLEAYALLEESEAGQFALRQIVDGVKAAGVSDAVRKARLLPAIDGRAGSWVGRVGESRALRGRSSARA